jgi:hypothetical protein
LGNQAFEGVEPVRDRCRSGSGPGGYLRAHRVIFSPTPGRRHGRRETTR